MPGMVNLFQNYVLMKRQLFVLMKRLLPGKHAIALLLLSCVVFCNGYGQKYSDSSAFHSYKGLTMTGYQGWYNAPGDGAGRGWNHYAAGGKFGPGSCKVDLWPDISEYKKTYESPFRHSDGSPARLFSSYDSQTVDLHFKWMKEYGIDGAFVQRAVSNIKDPISLHHTDRVLCNVLKASKQYQRAIAIMYDFSGMNEENNDCQVVINDWKRLVDSLHIAARGNKQTYLYHNGKPLVGIWGVGFPDRSNSLKETEKIIAFLKNDPVYGGCSVLLGVPAYWRDFGKDTEKDPYLHELIRKVDIVRPWLVGRFNEDSYEEFKDRIKADISWCRQNKLDYAPVVFPGFSWHNMHPASPMDQIPRDRGKFFWQQLAGAIQEGAEMLYITMFDEMDEGTAIFKITNDPPVGQSSFLRLETGVPGDYYLYLTGMAARMLRKEIPFRIDRPMPP
jgi:glycoprotein endo-alpha-1,2-mannosidase